MKRLSILLLMALLAAVSLMADDAGEPNLSVRAFQFRHKQADRAALVIKPLLGTSGSVSIQPGTNTLVVTDQDENLKIIAAALAKFDQSSRDFEVRIRLVAASFQPKAAKVPDDLREISAKLSGVLRFNSFENVGDATAIGTEGDPVTTDLDDYHAEFKIGEYDPSSDTIRVSDFQLSRMQKVEGSEAKQMVPVLKTSLNLKMGQTVVLGAARLPDSQRALMLVIAAKSSK